MRNFSDLTEREILALAIANEEEDGRIYLDIADGLRTDYPGSASVFTKMAAEESEHRHRLLEVYRKKFGEHIPLVRRQGMHPGKKQRASGVELVGGDLGLGPGIVLDGADHEFDLVGGLEVREVGGEIPGDFAAGGAF